MRVADNLGDLDVRVAAQSISPVVRAFVREVTSGRQRTSTLST